MTNRLAIWIGLTIVGFLALDHFVLHLGAPYVLMRSLVDLIEYLAVWR